MTADIRWQQRFSSYRKALAQLETFFQAPALNEREQQRPIESFEYTFELAWNTLREAFRLGLITDGDAWMLIFQDRNLTSHTYNRSTADAIAANISGRYLACFQQLSARQDQRLQEEAP
jgi:hypothetical protein